MVSAVPSTLASSSLTALIRRVVLLLALLAFVAQGYVLQTHLHDFAKPTHGTQVSNNISTPIGKADPVDVGGCRLCQQIALGNAFLAISEVAIPASLSVVWVALSALSIVFETVAPGFAWQSRAPPRH